MNAVPIVLNSSINQLYADMPIMIVNDYREVTVEKLAAFEQTVQFRNGIIAPRYKLWARYWLQEIAKYLPKTDYKKLKFLIKLPVMPIYRIQIFILQINYFLIANKI
jgi:hypothetical protein